MTHFVKSPLAIALLTLLIAGSGCSIGSNRAHHEEQRALAKSPAGKVVLTSIAGVNSNEVTVEIENGVAIIKGQVYDRHEVRRATKEVSNIGGVNRVINRLRSEGSER